MNEFESANNVKKGKEMSVLLHNLLIVDSVSNIDMRVVAELMHSWNDKIGKIYVPTCLKQNHTTSSKKTENSLQRTAKTVPGSRLIM